MVLFNDGLGPLGDLTKDPNFGRMYRNNYSFRKMYRQLFNEKLGDMAPKFKIDVVNGQAVFSYEPLGVTGERLSLEAAVELATSELNRTRTTTHLPARAPGAPVRTSATLNQFADMFRKIGLDVGVSRHGIEDEAAISAFQSAFRQGNQYTGIVNADEQKATITRFYRNGKALTQEDIDRVGGMTIRGVPEAMKRTRVAMTETIFGMNRVPSVGEDLISGATFNEAELFRRDVTTRRSVDALTDLIGRRNQTHAANLSRSAQRYVDTIIPQTIYETMADGLNYITRSGLNTMYDEAMSQLGPNPNPRDVARIQNEYNKAVRSGSMDTVRGGNILDVTSGENIPFLKGDATLVDERFIRDLTGMAPADSRKVTILAPAGGIKREFQTNLGSFLGLNVQGGAIEARSNFLTMSTFGDMLDPNNFLSKSLNAEMTQHLEDIGNGIISPGLERMIDGMADADITEIMDPAEARAALESKQFATRLRNMIQSGMDPRTNDLVTSQLVTALEKHYGSIRKYNSRTGEAVQLNIAGRNVPYYDARYPMQGSVSGHIDNLTARVVAGREESSMSGYIRLAEMADEAGGGSSRFGLNGMDIFRMKEAMGGMDLDDRLYTTLQYDSTAKRLMALTLRDPNEAGEYLYMDADIMNNHKFIPSEITAMWGERKRLQAKILGQGKNKQKQRWLQQLDEINGQLDSWFRGNAVTLANGKEIAAQNFISQVNLTERFTTKAGRYRSQFAAKSFATTAESLAEFNAGSFFRSFGQSGGSLGSVIPRAMAELDPERQMRFMGPFEYILPGYSELHTESGFFKLWEPPITTKKGERLTAEMIDLRLENEYRGRGMLGKGVNMQTMVDEFLQTYLDKLPDNVQQQAVRIMRANKFDYINRETLIDSFKKTGNTDIIDKANEIYANNGANFGRLIGKLQTVARAANVDIPIGIDEALFRQRGETNAVFAAKLRNAYAQEMGMSVDDVRDSMFLRQGYPTEKLLEVTETLGTLATRKKDLVTEATQRLAEQLSGMDFSDEELSRASDFITNYYETKQKTEQMLGGLSGDDLTDNMRRMLEAGGKNMTDDIAQKLMLEGMGDVSVNAASMRQLMGWGLLDADRADDLDRQMLAVGRVLTEQGLAGQTGRSVLEPLLSTTTDANVTSIQELFNRSIVNRITGPQIMNRISAAESLEDVMKFDLQRGIDPGQRDISMINRLTEIMERDRGDSLPGRFATAQIHADSLFENLEKSGRIENMEEYADYKRSVRVALEQTGAGSVSYRPRLVTPGLKAPGEDRLIVREIADAASDSVVKTRNVRERMTPITGEMINKAWNSKPGRLGIIGAGVFAGVGIAYRLTKDPTPEEMSGPPLLPGGSPYEQYIGDRDMYDQRSMYTIGSNYNRGYLYRVNVTGSLDTGKLQDDLGSITGGPVRSTIYEGRQTTSGRPSSRDLMGEMMGY